MFQEDQNNQKKITDNQLELFDFVDDQDQVIGQMTRAEAHDGSHKKHRAVVILVFNEDGKILLHKRSMTKDMYPGAWTTSCSGHVDAGENYLESAVRELEEELNIKVDSFELEFISKDLLVSPQETEFISTYKYVTGQKPKILESEVDEARYFDLNDKQDKKKYNSLEKAPDLVFIDNLIDLRTLTNPSYKNR